MNIRKLSKQNKNFRKVIKTLDHLQLVVMSIKSSIGSEIHKNTDQFIRVEYGTGLAKIGSKRFRLSSGDFVMIPAGTRHDIINTSKGSLQLYTIYSKKEHSSKCIQKSKSSKEC